MATRSPIVMRDAVPEDAAELVALWAESAAVSDEEGAEAFSYQSLFREPTATEAESAIEQTQRHPDEDQSARRTPARSSSRPSRSWPASRTAT